MINEPLLFLGLKIRTPPPIIIPIKGMGFIHHRAGLDISISAYTSLHPLGTLSQGLSLSLSLYTYTYINIFTYLYPLKERP